MPVTTWDGMQMPILDYGLVYRAQEGPLQLQKFADADHARCPEISKSVTGFVIKLNGCRFDWRSKKQDNVTTHTSSSELFAVHACTKVVLCTQDLLKGLGVKQTIETTLFCDNQSTLTAIANNGNSDRLRNYAKVIRYIAVHVDAGRLNMLYVPTTNNLADNFTKALGPTRFNELRDGLSVENTKAAWVAVPSETQALAWEYETLPVDGLEFDRDPVWYGSWLSWAKWQQRLSKMVTLVVVALLRFKRRKEKRVEVVSLGLWAWGAGKAEDDWGRGVTLKLKVAPCYMTPHFANYQLKLKPSSLPICLQLLESSATQKESLRVTKEECLLAAAHEVDGHVVGVVQGHLARQLDPSIASGTTPSRAPVRWTSPLLRFWRTHARMASPDL
ncbi:hypothetical protein ON010_g5031 [Phytophthora cinnamomi]|nr:hypothetical protein ON010_g5031 [Phytophthora cinnamomi]